MSIIILIISTLAAFVIGFTIGKTRKEEVGYLAEPIEKKYDWKLEREKKCWKRFCDREATTYDGLCQNCKDREMGF